MMWARYCTHDVMVAATMTGSITDAVGELNPIPGDKMRRVPLDTVRNEVRPCMVCDNPPGRGRHLDRGPVVHDAYCRCDFCVTEFGTEALP